MINVTFDVIDIAEKTQEFLDSINTIAAYDFETANRVSKVEREFLEESLKTIKDPEEVQKIRVLLQATGLSNPRLSKITHLSVATSEDKATVVIVDNPDIEAIIYTYLISTDNKQIWHNTLFDFTHILYNTGRLPKDFEDTMLMAKSLLNNADPSKAKVGLKDLMGYKYGDWGKQVKPEDFTLENRFNEDFLRYAAIDSCATYALYQEIVNDK
jgi:hypothetical protein